jgi:hypothetical protein
VSRFCFLGNPFLAADIFVDWNLPQIDVSIITKDRPRSLARLLSSLSNSIFFGDALTLRINLEQSADTETMQMVENFSWSHGGMFVHHRIIHGGLLPAVVESWYPHSNDTYGLLLEDDVELSPLFYAWAKMTILRYRYDFYCIIVVLMPDTVLTVGTEKRVTNPLGYLGLVCTNRRISN